METVRLHMQMQHGNRLKRSGGLIQHESYCKGGYYGIETKPFNSEDSAKFMTQLTKILSKYEGILNSFAE
jgi:hypothetical protein